MNTTHTIEEVENQNESQLSQEMAKDYQSQSDVINILEIEKMEKNYRKQLEQNLNNMRENHTLQINNLMDMIREKDKQIEQLQHQHQHQNTEPTPRQESRESPDMHKIKDVYAMIGKVQNNL